MPQNKVSEAKTPVFSVETTWAAAQEQLRAVLSADIYNLWFAPLRAVSAEGNHFVLEVANEFCEVWLKDNYLGMLQEVLAVASGRQMQVQFKINGAAPTVTIPRPASKQKGG
ncbi:MAG TPA: DnaA N-terminal domain-containing protein, partial [Verrucomicrobiae bacterium]|nr:DnaA N-terminal domain-containing protein [Verrucomicrobiae bacterium]